MKVALYLRVSTDEQAKHGDSLEAQLKTLEDYCRENNLKIVDKYIDAGISGQKTKRDEFQRLLKDVSNNKIDLILFTKLDRWFRNLAEYTKTNEFLNKYKVKWKAVLEPQFATDSAMSEAITNIVMSISQLEAKQTGERIKFVFENKIKNREVITGACPIGYKIENKRLVKDKEKENIVKDMFDYFELHNNKCGTKDYINNKYNLLLSYRTISTALVNPLYAGIYRDVEDFCESYISKERHLKIVNMSKRNIKKRYNDRIYIFSGLVFCEECGCNMAGSTTINKNKTKYIKYRCNQYYNHRGCTHSKLMTESVLEEYLINNIQELAKDYIISFEVKEKKQDNTINKTKIEKKMQKLKELYLNDLISLEEYKKDYNKYKEMLDMCVESTTIDLEPIKSLLNKDIKEIYKTLNTADKQALWRVVVKKIIISPDNTIKVEFL